MDRYLQTAWHGSPHEFDEFSTDAIGTGEGAQVYGHGLYFSEKKEVADHYKKSLLSLRFLLREGIYPHGRVMKEPEIFSWNIYIA